MKQYQHLIKEERDYIWQALRDGKSQKEVATALGRHPSTISREIKRNKYPQAHTYTYFGQCIYGGSGNSGGMRRSTVN